MNMTATVIRVNPQSLLVLDDATGQEVLVLTANPRRFAPGDRVRIVFSGQMTSSIPPQITATSIQRLSSGGPIPVFPQQPSPSVPSELRGVVLSRGRNFLLLRDNRSGRQFRVDFAQAHHFCPRQQVIVRYDTITMSNPPRVTATDITPVC